MTDRTNQNSAEADPQRVDVQDPLPEPNWLWRRVYTFTLSMLSLAFIWYGAQAMLTLNRPVELYSITRYMIAILAMLILFYMIAPSAEQIVKMIQASRTLRSGVEMTRKASSESPDGTLTEVETTAGKPATVDEEDYAPRSQK